MKNVLQRSNRRSIRLKGYDYSQKGAYFITICVQDKKCVFGEIKNSILLLNDAGNMIKKWYFALENKFSGINCGEFVIMPNHFHCIIINKSTGTVGADPCVCPDDTGEHKIVSGEHKIVSGEHKIVSGEHTGSPLHKIIQWFKTMTTNEYIRNVENNGWQRFAGKLWQRNYYEHIIRNEKSYYKIPDYIINNPVKWQEDKLFANPSALSEII